MATNPIITGASASIPFDFCTIENRRDTNPRPCQSDFGGLAEYLQSHVRLVSMTRDAYLKLPKREQAEVKDGPAIILARFKQPACREDKDVEATSGIGLDVDEAHVELDALKAFLRPYAAIIYESANSTPTARRWRVLIPYLTEATPEQHARAFEHWSRVIPGVGSQSRNPSRLWYAVTQFAKAEKRIFEVLYGQPFDVGAVAARKVSTQEALFRNIPPPDDAEGVRENDRSNTLMRYAARMVRHCASEDDLFDCLSEKNATYLPPMDSSEVRGIARHKWKNRAKFGWDGAEFEDAAPEAPPTDLWASDAFDAPTVPEGVLPRTIHKLAHADPVTFAPHGMALAALAAAATVASARLRVAIAAGWSETFNFWYAPYGVAGARKTPAIDRAFGTLKGCQAQLFADNAKEVEAWKALPPEERKATPKPEPRHLTTQNSTIEALGVLLANNPHGIALKHNELSSLLSQIDGQYRKGAEERGDWLALHDAVGRYTTHRIGRATTSAENWSAVIVGGITTDAIIHKAREMVADGTLARFCMTEAPPPMPSDSLGAETCPELEHFGDVVRVIFGWQRLIAEPLDVKLTPEARKALGEAKLHWETQSQLHRSTLPRYSERLNKYTGLTARFALGFHLIDAAEVWMQGGGKPTVKWEEVQANKGVAAVWPPYMAPISEHTVRRAQQFLLAQADHDLSFYLRLNESGVLPANKLARDIAAWILRDNVREFGVRELQQQVAAWKGTEDVRLKATALGVLEECNWIAPTDESVAMSPTGLLKGVSIVRGYRWEVHPDVGQSFAQQAEAARAASDAIRARIESAAARRRGTG